MGNLSWNAGAVGAAGDPLGRPTGSASAVDGCGAQAEPDDAVETGSTGGRLRAVTARPLPWLQSRRKCPSS